MRPRIALGSAVLFTVLLVLILRPAAEPTTASPHQPPAVPTVPCGAPSFTRADYGSGGNWPAGLATGDFNADGVPDLAVANWLSNTVAVMLGTGNGTFRPATPLPTGGYPHSVVTGSLRGDGRIDLLTAGYGAYPTPGVSVLLNNGNGTFATPAYYAAATMPWCAAAGDFNRDGKLDLAVGDEDAPNIAILLGNGDGTFAPAHGFPAGRSAWAVAVADANRDGKLDLAVADNFGNSVLILLGNGDGTFAAPRTFGGVAAPAAVVVADFNTDGKPDLALSTGFDTHDIAVLLGDGTGSFGPVTHFPAGTNPTHLQVADFNGDGQPDLAVANTGANDVSILLGRGNGTFALPANFAVGGYPTALAVADFNTDGRTDLAVANSFGPGYTTSFTVSVLLNNCVAPAQSVTPGPATPTGVPVSGTPTPAGTGTPCTVAFQDVHPADYFYGPVQALACRGVLSGYADGTYRPYQGTTRAQQVKIVVLGFGLAGLPPTPAAYTFADVRPGFPFFDVVETAAAHQLVSGYACGGPGEPCDALSRPYFRPYAGVTRGQVAKVVVAAARWPVVLPARPSFADVPPDSAFYPFVETATCHRVLSGYGCGGPGEPCDPTGRPYFRPANSATRGQIAKIVYGALAAPAACGGGAAAP